MSTNIEFTPADNKVAVNGYGPGTLTISGSGVTVTNDPTHGTIDVVISGGGGGGGTGTVTGGTNLGTGQGIFSDLNGANLEFKSLVAGSNITLTSDANTITIASSSSGGGGGTTEVYGTDVTSGNASTTTFIIPHGYGSTPPWYEVEAGSLDADSTFYVTADATNITVHYMAAPPNGTNNVTLIWRAGTPNGGVVAGGEANTSSNAGVTGIGIVLPKSGVNLPFKSIEASSTKIAITDDTVNHAVGIDVNQGNLSLGSIGGTASAGQLPATIVYTGQTNTFSALDQTIPAGNLKLSNSGFKAAITTSTLTANQTITIPNITDTLVTSTDSRMTNARTPTTHATTHKSGGSDSIALDTLAVTTDITTLNASTSAHGLLPKLNGTATTYLDGTGAWSTPATGSGGASTSAANTWTAVQTFNDGDLALENPLGTFAATIKAGAQTAARVYTFPVTASDTICTIAATQTLTNKTLTTPTIASIVNTGTLTLPTSTDTLVGRATTDTLTNKTLTTPVISSITNTGTLTLPTSTDTLVGRATTDTLSNKTIDTGSNTITNIANTNVSATAAIAYSKLTLTGSIVNADISTSAAIAWTKISKTGSSIGDLSNVVLTSPSNTQVLAYNGTNWVNTAASSGGGAPTTSQYVTLATDVSLTNERVLAVGNGMTLADGGAGSNVTLDANTISMPKNRVYFYDDFISYYLSVFSNYSIGSGTGAAGSPINNINTNAFGEIDLTTGTTATGSVLSTSYNNQYPIGKGVVTVEWRINLPTLSNGTNQYISRIGIGDNLLSTSADMNNGVYFEYDSSTSTFWKIASANAGVRTKTVSTQTVQTGYVRLKIVVNAAGTSASYYYNDSLLGSVSTNLPGASMQLLSQIVKSVGTTASHLYTDYVVAMIDLTTPR